MKTIIKITLLTFFLLPSLVQAEIFNRTIPCTTYEDDLDQLQLKYADEISNRLNMSPSKASLKDITELCVELNVEDHGRRVCEDEHFQWLRNRSEDLVQKGAKVRFIRQLPITPILCSRNDRDTFAGYNCSQRIIVVCD